MINTGKWKCKLQINECHNKVKIKERIYIEVSEIMNKEMAAYVNESIFRIVTRILVTCNFHQTCLNFKMPHYTKKICFVFKQTDAETITMLREVYGDNSMSLNMVFPGLRIFWEGTGWRLFRMPVNITLWPKCSYWNALWQHCPSCY